MTHPWIAQRTRAFDSSGIRKVFDLAAQMKDPINLSIGQPDFDVPQPVLEACIQAIRDGKNSYSLTQGSPVLREKLQAQIDAEYGHADRKVFVSSGTSGGLVLAMLSLVDPGDEVIIFDPYFVMYEPLVSLVGGRAVLIDTYPDFRIDIGRVADAITPRTKLILVEQPGEPDGGNSDAGRDPGFGGLWLRSGTSLCYPTRSTGSFCTMARLIPQPATTIRPSSSTGFRRATR
jgi:aspartate/methionine/tyrosine aminotransferase